MRMFRRCGVAALLLLCSGGLAAAADAASLARGVVRHVADVFQGSAAVLLPEELEVASNSEGCPDFALELVHSPASVSDSKMIV